MQIKLYAKTWDVAHHPEGYLLTIGERAILAKPEGVWECSRDGKATPLAKMDGSSSVYERLARDFPRS